LQEEEEIMPQIEEMARVPTKMMEGFVPLRKKCASYSSFTYFVLTLVLGMFIGKLLVGGPYYQIQPPNKIEKIGELSKLTHVCYSY
jgi:hypothetical protein